MVLPLGVQGMPHATANPLAGRNQARAHAGASAPAASNAGGNSRGFAAMPHGGDDASGQVVQMMALMAGMLSLMLMGLMLALGGSMRTGGGKPFSAAGGPGLSGATLGMGGATGGLGMPLAGVFRKTSDFGHRESPTGNGLGTEHTGVDLAARMGEPILATADGVVGFAGQRGDGFGNHVILNHGGGLESLYGHMSAVAVPPGTFVRKGQVIGYVGSTGYSTGPHLHFEMRQNGVPFDPDRLFPNLA